MSGYSNIPNTKFENYTGATTYDLNAADKPETATKAITGLASATSAVLTISYGSNPLVGIVAALGAGETVWFPYPLPLKAINSAGTEVNLQIVTPATIDTFTVYYKT